MWEIATQQNDTIHRNPLIRQNTVESCLTSEHSDTPVPLGALMVGRDDGTLILWPPWGHKCRFSPLHRLGGLNSSWRWWWKGTNVTLWMGWRASAWTQRWVEDRTRADNNGMTNALNMQCRIMNQSHLRCFTPALWLIELKLKQTFYSCLIRMCFCLTCAKYQCHDLPFTSIHPFSI